MIILLHSDTGSIAAIVVISSFFTLGTLSILHENNRNIPTRHTCVLIKLFISSLFYVISINKNNNQYLPNLYVKPICKLTFDPKPNSKNPRTFCLPTSQPKGVNKYAKRHLFSSCLLSSSMGKKSESNLNL